MVQEYEVRMGDKRIGAATVSTEGLYYRITIRCDVPPDRMHKVLLRCDGNEENLGILAPADGCFELVRRLPIRKIGKGELRFSVLPRHEELKGRFVPLSPEEPFRYISRLKDSFLTRRNGVLGVVIKEPDHTSV